MSSPPTLPPPIPAATPDVSLRARTSALESARIYRLTGDKLDVQHQPTRASATPPPEMISLRDIVEFRLRYFPTRVQTNRFECLLRTAAGQTWKITNQFYEGPLSFRDESPDYRAFVTALVARIAAANPAAAFVRGTSAAGYNLSLGFFVTAFLALVVVLLTIGLTFHWFVIVKLLIIVAFIPALVRYARRNRPRPFDPQHVPADVLPP